MQAIPSTTPLSRTAFRPKATLRVRAENATGMLIRLVGNGGRPLRKPVLVRGPGFTFAFHAPRHTSWVRAELGQHDARGLRRKACPESVGHAYCRNRILVFAMTSALYLRD